MNEVILFRDVLFRGPHTHVFQPEPDLTQNVMAVAYLHDVPNGFSWNDQTSSIVVVEGTWIFYFDVNYGGAFQGFPANREPLAYLVTMHAIIAKTS